jgi:ankyrin repeat protein
MAAMGGHRMVSEILLGEGGEIKACDNQGHTPAQLARMQGHNGLADFLRKWESETK